MVAKKAITAVVSLTAKQIREKFGDSIVEYIRGSKVKVVGPERHLAIQSPHFQTLGIPGVWQLASTLHLPVIDVVEMDKWP